MTLHARGYRRFEGARSERGPRFLPIFRAAWRDGTRGPGYTVMRLFIGFFVLVFSLLLVFDVGPAGEVMRRMRGMSLSQDDVARAALANTLLVYHEASGIFVVLLTLFVGSGLVADDLRTRALTLYLVRPVTPFDYFLGKWLVPVAALAIHVLGPSLFFVALAALLRPSGESWAFLVAQRDLVGTVVLHFAVLAAAYGSLVVLVSTLARRRIAAFVAGALAFMGGWMLAFPARRLDGAIGEVARSFSLVADGYRVLLEGLGPHALRGTPRFMASYPVAIAAPAVLLAACAVVVLRRARTTEVVS